MNVLLLGNSDSVFIRDFCTQVLHTEKINPAILTPALSVNYGKDYSSNAIREVSWPSSFLMSIQEKASVLLLRVMETRKLEKEFGFKGKIDALHMHYVEPMHLIYFFKFWNQADKRVLTFWGSDLFSASKMTIKLLPYFLKHATSIVFMIQNQCDYFQKVFGHGYDDKVHIIDFGNSLLNVVDQSIEKCGVEDCKRHFGLPTDKYIVHVGYNGFQAQQHLEILRGMSTLPAEMLCKIQLVFPVSYGQEEGFSSYQHKIETLMDESGMNYIFIDKYLQGEELAMFRRTCDIFLYGQKTDARSASPLEYIYAGAKFICPKWLADNYELLDEAGIRYYIYDDFEHLPNAVETCVKEMNLTAEKISAKSKKRIHDEISWDSLAEKWRRLYE